MTMDVNNAVQQAHQAFPLYKKTSAADRAAFLQKIADEIIALGEPLIALTQSETNLPEKDY